MKLTKTQIRQAADGLAPREMATKFDAQLHLLRSVARNAEVGRDGHEIESARFSLFAALQRENIDEARNWTRSLEVILKICPMNESVRPMALAAVEEIKRGLWNAV